MKLGNFSVSLAVKDIEASKLFYQKLGFTVFMGEQSQGWLIMKNGDHNIGLFQGMFDKNLLTFNPGWSSDAEALEEFTDVRELQRQLKASGVSMITEADESSTGPASFMIADPEWKHDSGGSTRLGTVAVGPNARCLRISFRRLQCEREDDSAVAARGTSHNS
jgi:hypothetical protein